MNTTNDSKSTMVTVYKTLNLNDNLPLTCTRTGTCCHGNQVNINPWELNQLAKTKNCSPKDLRDNFTDLRGIRLRFDGEKNELNKKSCRFYDNQIGCSIHNGRPLACRLFPIGRKIQNNTVEYIQQGQVFPCISECPSVVKLPTLKVSDYLIGQQTEMYELAQDLYLEVMQNIADMGFTLLLETPLFESNEFKTLNAWRRFAHMSIDELTNFIGYEWVDLITTPEINKISPTEFIEEHNDILQTFAQNKYGQLSSLEEINNASITLIGCALYLAKSIGSNLEDLIDHWIETAIQFGAKEN